MTEMTHALQVSAHGKPVSGILAYVRQDHSFDFQPLDPDHLSKAVGPVGTTSLVIGSLQIEVGVKTGRFLYVWGYHPIETWEHGTVSAPAYSPGEVSVVAASLKAGVSEPIAEVGEWRTVHDRSTGWIQLSADPIIGIDSAIEFAKNVVAGVASSRLVALWLRPTFD